MSLGVEAIFLDFYGTVTGGDRRAVERACAGIVRDLNVGMTPAEFAVHWGERFFRMIGHHNGERFMTLHELEFESLRASLGETNGLTDLSPYVGVLESYWGDPPIFEDAVEFLSQVKLPVCCVSNADNDHLTRAIAKHRLSFTSVITSESARSYKPHPQIFNLALERMGCRPDRVLHVGDSLHSDIGGAKQAGIQTAWICRDDRIHDIGTAKPDHTISRLTELFPLLNQAV